MYIMCAKVIAVPSQDSERSCILCVLKLSLYQARTVSGSCILCMLRLSLYQARTVSVMYIMCVKVIAVPSQDSERSCILCVLRLSLYQARTVGGHVYYVC